MVQIQLGTAKPGRRWNVAREGLMAVNLERFKKDLERLIELGTYLELAMLLDLFGKEKFEKQFFQNTSKEQAKQFMDKLPDFKSKYDEWYSEAVALIKQLLPDRLDDFRSFYEKPKGRKAVGVGSYVIQDFMQGLAVKRPIGDVIVDPSAALPQYQQQLAILRAAKRRFDSSLFEIRQIVQADLFDSEIEAARELLKSKFVRAAGAMAGVVLERHLKQVCDDHSVKVGKARPTIAVLNQALRDADVIDVPQWRFSQHLADIRNLCDHNKAREPTKEQVQDLIDGTARVLKTIS
jgi:hypothetical protein